MNLQNRLPIFRMGAGIFRMEQFRAATLHQSSVANAAMRPCLAHVAALHFIPGGLSLHASGVERTVSDNQLVDASVHVFDKIGFAVGVKHDADLVNDGGLIFAVRSGQCPGDRATASFDEFESLFKY